MAGDSDASMGGGDASGTKIGTVPITNDITEIQDSNTKEVEHLKKSENNNNMEQSSSNLGPGPEAESVTADSKVQQGSESTNVNDGNKMRGSAAVTVTGPGTIESQPGGENEVDPEEQIWESVIAWEKPMPNSHCMFPEAQPCGNIQPGDFSTPWLLGAFSAVGTRPELLQRIFGHEQNERWRESGIMILQLFKDYIWQEITIDTQLPADVVQSNVELWGPLLEKCFAKISGGYDKLEVVFMRDTAAKAYRQFERIIMELTGGCIESYIGRIEFSALKKKVAGGSLITCVRVEEGEESEQNGLISNAPYSVIDVVDENLPDGLKLIRMRNPWNSPYTGQFAPQDQVTWNKYPEVREMLKVNFNDGTFWITYKNFLQNFNHYCVCRLFPQEYYQYHFEGLSERQKSYQFTDPEFCGNPQYKIVLPPIGKPTQLFISMSQLDTKMTNISMLLFKSKPSQNYMWEFNEADRIAAPLDVSEIQREVTMDIQINPDEQGTHQYTLILFQNTQKPDPKKPYCLRVFANNKIVLEEVPQPFVYKFPIEFNKTNSGGKRLKTDATRGITLDSSTWCKNPQIFLSLKKPTTMKLICERIIGRKEQGLDIQIGAAITRVFPASQPEKNLGPVKKGRTAGPNEFSKGNVDLSEKVMTRKIQILPADWCKETSYQDENSAILVNVNPSQGPMVVIPTLSDEGLSGNSQVIIYSDKELHQAQRLPEIYHPVICGSWTSETAGGCHIYAAPFEPPKTSTWPNNPKIFLNVQEHSRLTTLTMARCERQWRQMIAKDAVGCMLGFYVLKLTYDSQKNIVVSRNEVIAETTFCPTHEVVMETGFEPGDYVIVLCTYEPHKLGEFIFYATSDAKFTMSDEPPDLEDSEDNK